MAKGGEKPVFEGQFRAIPLGDGWFGFAHALSFPVVEFLDCRARSISHVEDLAKKPIAFRVWVMKYAFTGRRWKKIGALPLRSNEKEAIWFFKQDTDGSLYRTRGGGEKVPASWEEIEGLERAAVWDPAHIEDRLRDHFAGRPNKWVESLKPKRTSS